MVEAPVVEAVQTMREEADMSLFMCSNPECKAVENTALCLYWSRRDIGNQALCSACDPRIQKWHGVFPNQSAVGYALLSDGFIAQPGYLETESFKFREQHQGLKLVKIIN